MLADSIIDVSGDTLMNENNNDVITRDNILTTIKRHAYNIKDVISVNEILRFFVKYKLRA